MTTGGDFHNKLNDKALSALAVYDFNSFYFPSFACHMIEFMIFLDSQLNANNKLCNPALVSKLSHQSGGKICAFYYLSYCCQMGYFKHITESLEQSDHNDVVELMPNQENSRPNFQHVKNKRKRDESMSSNEDNDKKDD